MDAKHKPQHPHNGTGKGETPGAAPRTIWKIQRDALEQVRKDLELRGGKTVTEALQEASRRE